ncbi:MAG: DUF4340 domain-containing protein [Ruminococcaceae bacterium]|nr:DUF4340 domain-containing protein [Oscillospiraceae bacterium]
MKKIRNLILIFVLLVALVAGYVILRSLNSGELPEEEIILAATVDTQQLKSLSYSYAGDDVTLLLQEGSWVSEKNPALPLDQTPITAMVGAIPEVVASRLIAENKDNASEFGFDEPTMEIHIGLADGSSVTYILGEINAMTTEYYFTTDATESIYLIADDLLHTFTKTTDDLILVDTLPTIDVTAMSNVTVQKAGAARLFTRDGSDLMYFHDQYDFFVQDGSEKRPIDSEQGADFYGLLASLSFDGCADYEPSEEKLAEYGLNSPETLVLQAYYTEKITSGEGEAQINTTADRSMTLLIGKKSADGRYYAKRPDSLMVCYLSAADAELIEGYLTAELTSRDVFGLDLSAVKLLTASYGGKSYEITYDEEKDSYKVGELSATVDEYSAFYTALEELRAEKVDASAAKGEKVFTLTAHRITNDKTHDTYAQVVLDIYVSGEAYVAEFDTAKGLVLSKESVDNVLSLFAELVA